MRKKSPASVQKWVDSIQIPPAGAAGGPTVVIDPDEPGPSGEQLADPDQLTASGPDCVMEPAAIEDHDQVLTLAATPQTPGPMVSSSDEEFIPSEEPAAVDHKPESGDRGSSSISIKNLLSKKTLLEKFSRSSTNLEQETNHPEADHEEASESRKSTSLASIGKIKINEFYDKLSMNKAKYNLIKAKKLDLRNMLSGGSQRQTPVEEALPEMVVAVPEADEQAAMSCADVTLAESDVESKMMQSEVSELGVK